MRGWRVCSLVRSRAIDSGHHLREARGRACDEVAHFIGSTSENPLTYKPGDARACSREETRLQIQAIFVPVLVAGLVSRVPQAARRFDMPRAPNSSLCDRGMKKAAWVWRP